MAHDEKLVPVGNVFATYPAHDKHDIIIGIEVTEHPFGTRNALVIQHPHDPNRSFTIRVHTLEHERMRTNVAHPGKEYGVKPFRVGSETLIVNPTGWKVFAPAHQSAGAAQRTPRTWPRPPRPENRRVLGQIK